MVLVLAWSSALVLAVSVGSKPPSVGLLSRLRSPQLVDTVVAQNTGVVRLRGFLSEAEAADIHSAAVVVDAECGTVDRSNGLTPGSWKTVYINHRMKELLPDLHARLQAAARDVDDMHWGGILQAAAERSRVEFRVAEHHTVLSGGGLNISHHMDVGSLVTMDIMLSDPHTDFEGGIFQVRKTNLQTAH